MPANTRILVVGAGGFGREVHSWISHWLTKNAGYQLAGFLDDDPAALAQFPDLTLAGAIRSYTPATEMLVCALGNPTTKLRVCEALRAKGARFLTLVHPSAVIGERVTLGEGCVVCPGAILTCDIQLGDFVTVNAAASVGHDARIGDGTTLSGHVDITGQVSVGKGVFFGSHANVIPRMQIGDYAVVGAGSTVVKRVKAGTTVFGVPAKQVAGF